MSQIKIDSEDIAEIKNALCIIQGNAELILTSFTKGGRLFLRDKLEAIIDNIKRIDNLLPKVAFEGGKQCQQLKKG